MSLYYVNATFDKLQVIQRQVDMLGDSTSRPASELKGIVNAISFGLSDVIRTCLEERDAFDKELSSLRQQIARQKVRIAKLEGKEA